MGLFSDQLYYKEGDLLIAVTSEVVDANDCILIKLFLNGDCVEWKEIKSRLRFSITLNPRPDIELNVKQGFLGTKYSLSRYGIKCPMKKVSKKQLDSLHKDHRTFTVIKAEATIYNKPDVEESKKEQVEKKKELQDISEDLKHALTQIGQLCLNHNDFRIYCELLDSMKDYTSDEDDYGSNLYYLALNLPDYDVHFFRRLDWKQSLIELNSMIKIYLEVHFSHNLDPDTFPKFPPDTIVGAEGVLAQYCDFLNSNGFHLLNLETDSDEFILIVHRLEHKDLIAGYINQANMGIAKFY